MASTTMDAPGAGAPTTGQAWLVWALATAFVVYLFGIQTGYAVVNPAMQADLGLSVKQVGTVAATYTWVFAVCQFFSGALLDRLGARKVIPPAIALVTLGAAIVWQASGYPMLIAAQFVLALGACAGFVGAGYVGGQWFGMARFSFMFGLVQFTASLSSAFSQNLFALGLTELGWRPLFMWITVVGIAVFALALLFVRNPRPVPGSGLQGGVVTFVGEVLSSLRQVAKVGHVWLSAVWGAMVFGAMLAAGVVWAPKLLVVRGMAPELATMGTSVLWLGLAAGCIVFPKWSDVARRRKLPTMVGIGLQLAAAVILMSVPQHATASAMLLCFIYGFGAAAHMLAFSTAGDVVPPELIGTASAVVNGVMFLASGVLISLPGQIVARQAAEGLQPSMATAEIAGSPITIGLALAFILAALMRETYPRPSA